MNVRCLRARHRALIGGLLLALGVVLPVGVAGQAVIAEAPAGFDNRTNGFVPQGVVLPVGVAGQAVIAEAPAGFDNRTNGFVPQGVFNQAKAEFERRSEIEDGLGPVYNAQACAECHQSPVTGGASQITELLAGRLNEAGAFVPHPGGGPSGVIIHSRATDASLVEAVLPGNDIQTLRISPSILGAGFVEAIDDRTLMAISDQQASESGGVIRGTVVMAPLLEAPGQFRVGRFGWKCQQPSVEGFAAGAYNFEMGVTSPLAPTENPSNGRSVAAFDLVPDPEDDGGAVRKFATFIRSTRVPPRDAALAGTPDATAGEQLFNQIGCASCHRPSITTGPAGTAINGGTFVIPPALGGKMIHPYGDFLLHDVGTGDGIGGPGPPSNRNKVRTASLWGVRARNRLMHDGLSVTLLQAIMRHQGEAAPTTGRYLALPEAQQQLLLTFLRSL